MLSSLEIGNHEIKRLGVETKKTLWGENRKNNVNTMVETVRLKKVGGDNPFGIKESS